MKGNRMNALKPASSFLEEAPRVSLALRPICLQSEMYLSRSVCNEMNTACDV